MKKLSSIFVIVIVLSAFLIGIVNITSDNAQAAGLANTPWPMFHGNAQHTGLSPYDTSKICRLRGIYAIGWGYKSNPAIGLDGTIYVGADDNHLYALNSDGTVRWTYYTGNIESSPAIGEDGTIYASTLGLISFIAVNPGGTLKWSYDMGGSIDSSPVISTTGTIYVSSSVNLYAINSDGTLNWTYPYGKSLDNLALGSSSPAISPEGTIYVGSTDGHLYAINPNGSLKWNYLTDSIIDSSPAIGSDGSIYVGSNDGRIYAFSSTGSVEWAYTTGASVRSSPAIGPDDTIYVGSDDNYLYALNPDGTLKWKFQTGDCVDSSPAIGSDGTIYVGSQDYYLYAINPDGSLKWSYKTHSEAQSPVIGSAGTVYVRSYTDIYVFGSAIVPFAPLNLQFSIRGSSFVLRWDSPSDNGSSPIKGYKIYRGTKSGIETYYDTVGGNTTMYIDSNVTANHTYYYKICAVNKIGDGNFSEEISARGVSENDFDGDSLLDSWEIQYFGNLNYSGSQDYDGDHYTNLEEYTAGTDPTDAASHPAGSSVAVGGTSMPLFLILIIVIISIVVVFVAVSRRKKVSSGGKGAKKPSSPPVSSSSRSVPPPPSSRVPEPPKITKEEVDRLYDLEKGGYVYGFGDFFAYKIGKNIGSGGFSEIYLVAKGGEKYAMKIPKGVDMRGEGTLELKDEDIKTYAKEAKIWATLTEKVPDSVVDLIDIGIRPFPWFAMELADYSLKDKMNMPMNAKLRTMANLLRKLEEIHGNKVVHKDIKPENILYAGGQWKFTDFGLSKIIDKSSKSTMLSGTPWYMAPEQVSPGGEYGHSDVRTDVWGMGVVLYEMLTGVSPFRGERYEQVGMAILFQEPKKPSEINPEIPKELDEIVMKALKKKKDERWQSAEEFRKAIERFLEDTHV